MHEYLFDLETVRLAIILGVIVSMLFYERLHLTTGGAIVPGYLAIFLPRPLLIAVTLLAALATYYFVNVFLARRWILYGRAKFEAEVLTSLAVIGVLGIVARLSALWSPELIALYGIGFVIPGIIAHDMKRQGPAKTSGAVLLNTAIVGVFIFIYHSLLRIAPGYRPAPPPSFDPSALGYAPDLLFAAVVASVLAGMFVFRRVGVRTGGFIMGAYWALVLLRPLDLLFAVVVGGVTYLFVTRFLMRHMLLFGRRKLSMMVLSGAIFAWGGEFVVRWATGGAHTPWSGFHVITLFVPAMLANDAERQGFPRTLCGTALTATAVFAVVNLMDAARIAIGWARPEFRGFGLL